MKLCIKLMGCSWPRPFWPTKLNMTAAITSYSSVPCAITNWPRLGLQAWPLSETAYSQMLVAGFDGDASGHWTRRWHQRPMQPLQVHQQEEPEPVVQQVYMLIEFLAEQETAVSPIEMMRLMAGNTYHGWVADVLTDGYEWEQLTTQLLAHISAQSAIVQQAEPPIPLPSGTITLVCGQYLNSRESSVHQYDFATGTWTERFPFPSRIEAKLLILEMVSVFWSQIIRMLKTKLSSQLI